MSKDFGATWDEPQQRQKAHHLLDYWSGRSTVLPVPDDGAHWYGAPFDVVAASIERASGTDPYITRHAVNAVVGWLGIVAAWKLAERLFSPAAGLLTIVLLIVNPRYIADSMNNPKDLPFATVATTLLLLMTRVRHQPPFLSGVTCALMGSVLGLAINIRAGALMFAGYLAVLLGHRILITGRASRLEFIGVGLRVGAVVLGALSIGWVAWPWAYDAPITAPFRAMSALSRFPWGGAVLFDGQWIAGTSIPGSYIPRWLWLVLPPVVAAGAIGSVFLLCSPRDRGPTLALWGAVLFPIAFVAGTGATIYDGLRHLLFIVPPLTILSAAAWVSMLRELGRGPSGRVVATAALAAGIAEPFVFQLRNHPHQTAYIQPLAGGPAAAFARYDLDYWGNCLFQAMARVPVNQAMPVRVTGWPLLLLEANVSRFPGLEVVPESEPHLQFDVRLVRGAAPDLWNLAQDPTVVERIATADGALLCVVRQARAAMKSDTPDTQNGLADSKSEAAVDEP